MKVTGALMKILIPHKAQEYQDAQLYDEGILKEGLKAILPQNYPVLAEQIVARFLEDHPEIFPDLQTCFSNLYRVFSYFLKEEGMGIFKSIELRNGFMRLADNIALPCDLTQAVVVAVLKSLGLRGVRIKETLCQLDNSKFCEYQAVWLSSNVS